MKRMGIALGCAALLGSAGWAAALTAEATGTERPFVIYNEDSDNVLQAYWHKDPAHYTEAEIRDYVRKVIGGGKISHFFACVNARVSSYPSKVAPNLWDALEEPGYDRPQWLRAAKDLVVDQGVDQFRIYNGEYYFFEESYDSKGFPDAFYVDITSVAAEKERLIRLYACQNADDAMCKEEMRNSRMRAGRLWPPRLDGYAEAFAPYVGRPQGPCIFAEIPRDPVGAEMPEWGR